MKKYLKLSPHNRDKFYRLNSSTDLYFAEKLRKISNCFLGLQTLETFRRDYMGMITIVTPIFTTKFAFPPSKLKSSSVVLASLSLHLAYHYFSSVLFNLIGFIALFDGFNENQELRNKFIILPYKLHLH